MLSMYMLVYVLFVLLYLKVVPLVSVLKGNIPYKIPQVLNILSKTILMLAISVALMLATGNLGYLNYRVQALSNWTIAENVFRINIAEIGQLRDFTTEEAMLENLIPAYDQLVSRYMGFIADSRSIHLSDIRVNLIQFDNSEEILRGSITVSPNYFDFNPIFSTSGNNVMDYIIFDDYVLNILIPTSLLGYKEEIISAFYNKFYFQVIEVPNWYNEVLNRPLISLDPESLQINVIEVLEGQQYFTFQADTRVQDGNTIEDIVAMVYTRNFHPSFMYSAFTHSFYFHTEAIDAFGAAHSVFFDNNLGALLHSVESVYDDKGAIINHLSGNIVRNIFLIVVLFFAYVVFTYNYVENYISKNKRRLFIKKTLGFSAIKRNSRILVVMTFLAILGVLVVYSFLSINAFLLGLILIICDIFVLLVLENRHISKYHTET